MVLKVLLIMIKMVIGFLERILGSKKLMENLDMIEKGKYLRMNISKLTNLITEIYIKIKVITDKLIKTAGL